MASPDIRKRTIYFLVAAALIVLVLVLFPLVEEWSRTVLAARFGYILGPKGAFLNSAFETVDPLPPMVQR